MRDRPRGRSSERGAHTPASGPVHAEIADALAADIAAGRLSAGDRLLPEREFAAEWGVSRMTLRQALDTLERRGLITRAVGRYGGTFVNEPKVQRDLSHYRGLSDELSAQGIAIGAREISAVVRTAGPAVAGTLQIEPTAQIYEIARTRLANGRPVALERTVYPAARYPGLLDHPLDGSLSELMRREYGETPQRSMEYLEPVLAGPEEARALEVAAGAPLMYVERVVYDRSDTPVELSREHFRGDRTRMVVWNSEIR
jgi:GntR family transcriptional regulator